MPLDIPQNWELLSVRTVIATNNLWINGTIAFNRIKVAGLLPLGIRQNDELFFPANLKKRLLKALRNPPPPRKKDAIEAMGGIDHYKKWLEQRSLNNKRYRR